MRRQQQLPAPQPRYMHTLHVEGQQQTEPEARAGDWAHLEVLSADPVDRSHPDEKGAEARHEPRPPLNLVEVPPAEHLLRKAAASSGCIVLLPRMIASCSTLVALTAYNNPVCITLTVHDSDCCSGKQPWDQRLQEHLRRLYARGCTA
jgi:hypothetical protein